MLKMRTILILSACVCGILCQGPQVQTGRPGSQLGFPGSPAGFPGTQSRFPGSRQGFPGSLGGIPGPQTRFPGTTGFVGLGGPSGANQPGQPRPGFPIGGFGTPVRTPFGPGPAGFGTPGQMFGPMGPLRPLSAPLSPMAMMMASLAQNPNNYRYATCTFNDTWSSVKGRADFRQFLIGEGRQQVQIRIQLTGLPQSMGETERGIHVHEFGDIGDGCARVGPHFNPNQTPHGSQRNFAFLRHVGDLGNIRQTSDGIVSTEFVDQVLSLEGTNNVVGRSFVIKIERDDEGMGVNRESRVNGNTINPMACCTIGRTTAINWYNPLSESDLKIMGVSGIMPPNKVDPFNANTFANTGSNPGINTGFQNNGANTGFPNTGVNTGFSFPGGMQTGSFSGTPGGIPPGFGSQSGFGGQPGAGGLSGQPGAGGFGGQPGAGGFGGQPGAGGFGGQPGAGGFSGQPGAGGFGGQSGTGGFGGQSGAGGFGGQPGAGGFGGQPGAGGFGGQQGVGGFGGQPGAGGFGGQSGTGGFGGMSQTGTGSGMNTGLTQTGPLTQPGFTGTNTGSGQPSFGASAFMPEATQGQSFNFAAQGKKKK